MIDVSTLRAAAADIDVFARELVGAPLWPHQLELARCEIRRAEEDEQQRHADREQREQRVLEGCPAPGRRLSHIGLADGGRRG